MSSWRRPDLWLYRLLQGLAGLLIAAALLISLGRGLLPHINNERQWLENELSAALGRPFSVASISGLWQRGPQIELRDLAIDGDDGQALRADRVLLGIDLWHSLAERRLQLRHVELEGLHLFVEQQSSDNSNNELLELLFSTDLTISVRDTTLHLRSPGQPPQQLTLASLAWQHSNGQIIASGELLGSYCLTEPGAGSDAAALKTRATREGDSYLIEGTKVFISGAGSTDVLVLMARTGDAQSGASGISAFAVPADAPGISYGKKEQKMGWNSQPTRTISFDNVRIPADHLLGREGEGFKIAMKGLDGGRINIATCSVGAAQGALNAAQQYMQDRKQFGKPIASFQALQFKLADMLTDLTASRQMVRLAAHKLDHGHGEASLYCAMAKRFATDHCFTLCNEALQLHGGYGYLNDYPLERWVRDSRVHQILEGTNEIMRVIIARRLLDQGGMLDRLL